MKWEVQALEVGPFPVRLGRLRPSAGAARGTVLFVPGRGDSLELRQPVARALAAQGFAVVLAEHHGQGGSGHLGRHPDAVHVDDFQLHVDTQRAALERIDGPVRLLAHSMGGLVGLELIAERPARFNSAAFTSPMWRFTGRIPTGLIRFFARLARVLGRERDYAPGEGPFSLDDCLRMRRGSDEADEELVHFVESHGPLLRGGSTWGWVGAAASNMQRLRRQPLERVDVEMLVVSCLRDRSVSLQAHEAISRRLPRARRIEVDCGHDPFFAPAHVRTKLWDVLRSHMDDAT